MGAFLIADFFTAIETVCRHKIIPHVLNNLLLKT